MNKKILATLATGFLLVSCRSLVTEDRIQCPRFLFFNISNSDKFNSYDPPYVTVYSHPEGKFLERDTTTVGAINNNEFYFSIKGELAVKGYGMLGYKNSHIENDSDWIIPLGSDSDPLFRFDYTAATQEESFTVPVELVKEYCHVRLQFVNFETFESADGHFPFDIRISGNTCGIEALSGTPIRGRFECWPEEGMIGQYEFTLPRQADRTLRMELTGKAGVYDAPDVLLPFDLWSILHEKGGVTWEEKNLPDANLIINYQEKDISVSIVEWSRKNLDYNF